MASRSKNRRRSGATAAQLRDDIDSGRTGDKSPSLDPAAAPLGTDDEAGGASISADEWEKARRLETTGKPAVDRNRFSPEITPSGASSGGLKSNEMLVAVVGALVVLTVSFVLFTAS